MGSRSDKKEQSKPYVSIVVMEVVEDLARYIGNKSNGETARRVVLTAFEDWRIIEQLQKYLRWDYTRGDHSLVGHDTREDITSLLPGQNHRTVRLPIRFTQDEIKRMETFHSCLSCPWAHMVGALLRLGIESNRVLQVVAPGYSYRSAYSLRRGVFK